MSATDPIQQGRDNWVLHGNGPVDQIGTATALIRGSQVIQSTSATVVSPSLVTNAQLELLVALDRSEGPASLTELANDLSLHPTTVARTVTRLARRGYALRTQDPADGRVAVISITATGRDIVGQALQKLTVINFGLAGWDIADAQKFVELVTPLLNSPDPSGSAADPTTSSTKDGGADR